MEYRADLHTHSTASDGQYKPVDLVEKAQKAGVEVLALTDHDTIDGVEEAICAGQNLHMKVLRGVELGASEDRHMHILGLALRPDCIQLAELCRKLRESRDERKYRIVLWCAMAMWPPHGRHLTAIWIPMNTNESNAIRQRPPLVLKRFIKAVAKRFWRIPISWDFPMIGWSPQSDG